MSLGLASPALAAIMLDMGPTSAITFPANSPAHATGAIPTAETSWNTIFDTNRAAGTVLNSDGTTATGVSVVIGQGSAIGVTSFSAPSVATNLTGSTAATLGSDYNGTAAQDGIFKLGAAGGSTTASVGVRIDGLAAGTYTIFGVLRNTNASNNTSSEALYVATGAASSTFTFSSLTPAIVGNLQATGNTTWIAGDQYATQTVTLAAGESLYVIANGAAGSTESRGMMNAIQIVVPEPGTAAAVLVGLATGFARRPRRR
ncbi:MAG: PEP-CTERM sorting domain-containing protein [Phycisphaerae bacterium]|nr:PEP-CTERM sorting domain-containing protein [Tepidisphaeraceae bacterium]